MPCPAVENKVSFKKTDLDLYINELKKDLDDDEEMEHDVKIFHNALSFSNVIARDCMVPRNEIVALELNDNIEELKKTFIDSGYSRIMIFKENIDNGIVGKDEYTKSIKVVDVDGLVCSNEGNIAVQVCIKEDENTIMGYTGRMIKKTIQDLRKDMGLHVWDEIEIKVTALRNKRENKRERFQTMAENAIKETQK